MNKKQKEEYFEKALKTLKSKWFTKREREILLTIYNQKILSITQLEEIHFKYKVTNQTPINNSKTIALRRIKKLVNEEILNMFWYSYDYQRIIQHYVLGPTGAFLVASFLDVLEEELKWTMFSDLLKIPNIVHTIEINNIRLYFEKFVKINYFQVEQICRINYNETYIEPDAIVEFEYKNKVYKMLIERDRGTMNKDKFKEKVKRYENMYVSKQWENYFNLFPFILVVTKNSNRVKQLALWIQKFNKTDITYLISTDDKIKETILEKVWFYPNKNTYISII